MTTEEIVIRISAEDQATKVLETVAQSVSQLQTSFKGIGKIDTNFDFGELEKGQVIVKGLSQSMVDLTGFYKNWAKGIDSSIKPVKENISGFTNLNSAIAFSGLSMKDFSKWQKQTFFTMDNGIGLTNALTGDTLSYGRAVQLATIQNRRFKMEWLSIMFAGMALSRAFGSIVKAQQDLWGWSQMTAAAWTTVMAPAMELISPIIEDITDKISNLPEDTKLVIGLTVLGLGALGDVMMVVGQFYLAMQGLGLLFPLLATKIGLAGGGIAGFFKVIGAAIAGIGSTVLIVIAIILAVIIGMYIAWKNNFLGMKNVVDTFIAGFKMMFAGIVQVVTGILNIVKGLFSGDFTLIDKGIKQVFDGIWKYIKGGFVALSTFIVGVLIGAIQVVWGFLTIVVNGFIFGLNKVIKLLGGKEINWRMPNLNNLPGFEMGGLVPETGPAILHKGEQVIPADQVGQGSGSVVFSPSTSINANVSNSYDVRQLANELNKYWASDFQRMMRSRGSI